MSSNNLKHIQNVIMKKKNYERIEKMTNLGYNGYLMPRFGSLHMILKLLVYVRFAILKNDTN